MTKKQKKKYIFNFIIRTIEGKWFWEKTYQTPLIFESNKNQFNIVDIMSSESFKKATKNRFLLSIKRI